MVLWKIKAGLAAERIDADYVPLAVALVVVNAVHQFKTSVAVHIDQSLWFGPHHLGRLRWVGLNVAQPTQRQRRPVVVNDLGVHAEIGHYAELGVRIFVDIGGPEPAVVAVPVVLQLHLGRPGGPVEDEDAVVGGHDYIELAIDIDVNYENVGVPGIGKKLGLPHHPRLAAIVREQPALLGLGPAGTERISHLKAL